jgi:hypothetical protein
VARPADFLTPSGHDDQLYHDFADVTLDWTYTTNAFWGENGTGTWTVRLIDIDVPSIGSLDTVSIPWNSFQITLRSGDLIPAPTPGDFNLDTFVDADDLAAWTADFGARENATLADGDADDDHDVDGNDFLIWQRNVAVEPPAPAVPEPAAGSLAAIAALSVVSRPRRWTNSPRRTPRPSRTRLRRGMSAGLPISATPRCGTTS